LVVAGREEKYRGTGQLGNPRRPSTTTKFLGKGKANGLETMALGDREGTGQVEKDIRSTSRKNGGGQEDEKAHRALGWEARTGGSEQEPITEAGRGGGGGLRKCTVNSKRPSKNDG